jgi:hypothetical protein
MTQNEFFEALGYLASPNRICKLDVELPATKEQAFKAKYAGLSGLVSNVDQHNFYLWPKGTNKWSIELRIYFSADNRNNIPIAIRDMVVSPRFSKSAHNRRINNNKFIWELIKYGFLLRDNQEADRIRNRVPDRFLPDFERGFSL